MLDTRCGLIISLVTNLFQPLPGVEINDKYGLDDVPYCRISYTISRNGGNDGKIKLNLN